jgi:hypothetical protein
MSAGNSTATHARVTLASEKTGVWQRRLRAFGRLRRNLDNPYSPVVSVSLLLLVGLLVKSSPAIHALLGQN